MTELSIAVLCGGDSSRFGGDKTRVKVRGMPLYRLMWNRLKDRSDNLFLQIDPEDEYELPTNTDVIEDGGPLGGIYSALAYAEHNWIFVSGCDLPYLDPRIVDALYSVVDEETEVVIPRWNNGYLEPLTALYHRRVLSSLEAILESGTRKITDFLDGLDEVREISVELMIEEGTISPHCFYNLNTREDLEKLDISENKIRRAGGHNE